VSERERPPNMNNRFLRLATILAAGVAQSANGQTAGTFPTFPRVWTVERPPAVSQAATDSNFILIMTDKVLFGRPTGPYPLGLPPTPTAPETAAWQVAMDYTINRRGEPLAIQLCNVFSLGLWSFSDATHYTVEDGARHLYQHPRDEIRPFGQPPRASIRVRRTPWMTAGIAETGAWSRTFCQNLSQRIAAARGAIPRPSHFLFDEEVPVIGKELDLADLVNYWQALQADPRWKSDADLVPGLTASLCDNWIAAGAPQLAVVAGTPDWRYWRGSEQNQRWWTWWSQVCMTAYAGALDQAFYEAVREFFPADTSGPVPLCSDYDQSLVLDGQLNPEVPGNGAANSYISFESLGGFGPGGQRFVFKQPGNLANIAQAPHLYGDFSLMHLQYFNGATFGNAAWSSSDDNQPGVPPPEQWGQMESRMIRQRLDACVRSAEGRSRPLLPWLTLPNQFTSVGCDNGNGVQQYRAQRFPFGMPVRQSNTLLTRTLASCKSHGVKELVLWNDSDTSIDNQIINHGLHCQWFLNWDLFRQAASNAYGFTSTSVYGDANTTITLPGPTSASAGVPAGDLLAYTDGDYQDAWRGKLRVAGNAPGVGTWLTTRFTRQTTNTPATLEFNIELKAEAASKLWLYVRGSGQTTWTQVTDCGIQDANGGTMGLFPYTLNYNRTTRVRASIPYNPAYFPAGGDFHVAIYTVPTESFRTMASMVDLVQVYGVNQRLRPVGDVNGDYVYDAADRAMFLSVLNDYITGSDRFKPRDRPILDVNRDGVINWNDLAAYDALCANGGGALLIDDDRYSTSERP
jgi:hypothetical protein